MSVPPSLSFAPVEEAQPDSIFTWIFEALSGNRWGGTLVLDSAALAPGHSIGTAHGRYLILAETEFGTDLSAIGLADRQVFVDWYRTGTAGAFLPTLAGSSVASGQAGLGSELDRAWTGSGWEVFGLGGELQVFATSAPAPRQPP
jgi:hypothetical protein